MKIFLTTDWHYGIYQNNIEKWLDIMDDYFYNFFIPYIKKNKSDGDIIIHCGDLFDNRTSIHILALHRAYNVVKEISKIMPMHIIVGNHDIWTKSTNDINSLCAFKDIKNVYIYDKTNHIDVLGKRLILMPWIPTKDEMINEIIKNDGDYLFCHSELSTCKMHWGAQITNNDNMIDVDVFKNYKHVFSGHIHIKQTIRNFTFIGSPYQMNRNDLYDQKGITILNLDTGNIIFEPNNHSPVFKKIKIINIEDLDKLENLIDSKDHIDLHISNKLLINNKDVRRKIEKFLEVKEVYHIEYINDINTEENINESNILDYENNEFLLNLDHINYIKEYIKTKKYDEEFEKNILYEYENLLNIYNNIINS